MGIGNFNGLKSGANQRAIYGNDDEFPIRVQKGLVPGHSFVWPFGHNEAVSNSAFELIWEFGGGYSFPTTAQTVDVTSVSANDTAAGTGARTIEIFGLDASYLEISEIITMNGTTAVSSVNNYIRINSAYTLTAGSGGNNAGAITILFQTDATVGGYIQTNDNTTEQCIYTIPADKTGYLCKFSWANQGGKGTKIRFCYRPFGGLFRVQSNIEESGQGAEQPCAPIVYQAKTDLILEAKASTGNHSVSGTMSIFLVDD
jgi:hypothetical protein